MLPSDQSVPNQQDDGGKPKAPPLASPDNDESFMARATKHHDSTLDISTASLCGASEVTSLGAIVCRICYSTCGTLYAFCKCKGSVGYVHKDCLKRWIDAKLKANRCEICHAEFIGTEWSFKPIRKWKSPKMTVLDKFYVSLFICCSIIVLYSIPWISYKTWRSRDIIFGSGPVTPERIFALIVIAIYVPLNISCIASLYVLWRRAVYGVFRRFFDMNKMWRVRITSEVSETKLINAINSVNKNDDDGDAKITIETRAESSNTKSKADETLLSSPGEISGDSTAMLITRSPEDGAESHKTKLTTEV